MIVNHYNYNKDTDELDWVEADDEFWDEFEDYEDGFDPKTGEYYWVEMSHYTLPKKTKFEYFMYANDLPEDIFIYE